MSHPQMKATHTPHHGCEKCKQNFELFQTRLLLGGIHYGERWSGKIDFNGRPEHRWYDVSKARNMLEASGAGDEDRENFSVAALWQSQVSLSYIDEGHLHHTDPAAPVLLVTTHVDRVHGDSATLIDGIHRVARAKREGRANVSGFRLSLLVSQMLLIEPRQAVLDELATEAVASGGIVREINGAPYVIGGTLRDSTADDHPLRAEMVAEFRRGPVALTLPQTSQG